MRQRIHNLRELKATIDRLSLHTEIASDAPDHPEWDSLKIRAHASRERDSTEFTFWANGGFHIDTNGDAIELDSWEWLVIDLIRMYERRLFLTPVPCPDGEAIRPDDV